MESTYGIISLIPVIIVIVTAIITRRTVEPLIIGAVAGYVILHKASFFIEFLNGLSATVAENSWYILVFGFFGMVIVLLEKSGGALGFGDWGAKICKSRGVTILITWILGIIVFIDDYLNNLGVGTAMRTIGDKNKVAREFLAYVINTTGACVCVLVPMSTWAIYMMGIYENIGVVGSDGTSYSAYIETIPFMIYAWIAVLVVPLFAFKIIPTWGPMKQAWIRAENGDVYSEFYHQTNQTDMEGYSDIKKSSPWNFFIPMIIIIGTTIFTNDILIGMAAGFISCLVIYIPQKLMTVGQFCDHSLEGFKSMVLVTAIVISAFVLQKANADLGLTEYIISVAEPIMTPALLPVLAFIICAFVAMCTGSFWGTMAIASPILLPLAMKVGVNPLVIGGAIASAGAFGSHACFYGDAVTLASAVTGISNNEYMRKVLPIVVLPTGVAIIGYLILGFVM